MTDELMHIGIPRRSGRYKWGSGKRPFQSSGGSAPKSSSGPKTKKVPIEDVPDDVLQKQVARLNLENSYYSAVKQNRANKKKNSRVKKVVGDILEDSAKLLAKQIVTSYSKQLGMTLFPGSGDSSKKKAKT